MNSMEVVEIEKKIHPKIIKEVREAYYNGTIDNLLKKYGLNDEDYGKKESRGISKSS